MAVRWFLILPMQLTLTIIASVMAPIFALFAKSDGTYPWLLVWASTPDMEANGDPNLIPYPETKTGWGGWWNRTWWMFRNSAYYADWVWFSYRKQPEDALKVWGSKTPSDPVLADGWYFATAGYAWQLLITHHWSATRTTKINIGWKLWQYPKACQFVFSPFGFFWPIK